MLGISAVDVFLDGFKSCNSPTVFNSLWNTIPYNKLNYLKVLCIIIIMNDMPCVIVMLILNLQYLW